MDIPEFLIRNPSMTHLKEVKLEWLPIGKIFVIWKKSQRDINQKQVAYLVKNYVAAAFNTIAVCKTENGLYHCIDGQHRLEAAREIHGDKHKVPCTVVPKASEKEAAGLFMLANKDRTSTNAVERFRIAVTAGYPDETAIEKILVESGFSVSSTNKKNTIRCPHALLNIYSHGGDHLRRTVNVQRRIFGTGSAAYDASLLTGMSIFLDKYKGAIDEKRLTDVMRKAFDPDGLHVKAAANKLANGGSRSVAVSRVIVKTYNDRLRGPKLLPVVEIV